MESYEDKQKRFEKSSELKKHIIEEAEKLSVSTEWKATSHRMKELMDEWKKAGYSGKDNNEQWEIFQKYRQVFFERQDRYFEELKVKHAQALKIKQELILETRRLVDLDASIEKEAGDIHKKTDLADGITGSDITSESVSDETGTASETVQSFQASDGTGTESQTVQGIQISGLDTVANTSGQDSKAISEQMRDLMTRWKSAGSAGREDDERLWEQFNSIRNEYYGRKKAIYDEIHAQKQKKHDEWVGRTEDAIARRQNKLKRLYEQNRQLRDRLYSASIAKQQQINEWMEENSAQIKEIEKEVSEMKARISR